MSKIDVSGWKEFKVGKLFEKISTKSIPFKSRDLPQEPDAINTLPLIAASATSQGISRYVDPKYATVLKNCLTVTANGNAKTVFYQDSDFSILQDSYPIQLIDKYQTYRKANIYLFLASAIEQALINNDWNNKSTWPRVQKKIIKLPVTSTGEPDWQYMDEYIEKLATQARKNVSSLATLKPVEHKIDIKAWKEFKITEWFTPLKVSHKLAKADLLTEGKYPCYSSEIDNHGIAGYTNKPDFEIDDKHTYLIFGDHTRSMELAITPFSVLDNVKVLVSDKLPLNALLFIESAWHKAIPNLGYARHWSVASKTSFSLPVTSTGQPDFDYMEKYIDNMQSEAHESLELLKQI